MFFSPDKIFELPNALLIACLLYTSIASINVQIGDRVKAGQLLASLDDRVLRSQYESQKAHIASAQAQVHEWESEEETAKSDLRRATLMLSLIHI